ncbi:extracellular solute-binding protein [Abyssibius alkaniclasticus]|uniref:extracellular solute-binding protein n=1 Tax=Abyssibius alkaniclasticus TaxID=2881234 RepID=UPI004059CCA3
MMSRMGGFIAAAAAVLALGTGGGGVAQAEPSYAISMYGTPALGPDYTNLPYANPDAPKGGQVIYSEYGGFDAFSPYIVKGRAPYGVRAHVYESLMGRSYDEPFTLYCLICETIDTNDERSFVEFTLREEAAFSNGEQITVEDVIWSFETLGTRGVPSYLNTWNKVESVTQTGPRSVRFEFNTEDRELVLIIGLRPILRKADWPEGRDFEESDLVVPIGSGPYVVGDFEPGRYINFDRNPDYWGRDLPFNRGRHNLDRIRYEYFTDANAMFQSFTAGLTNVFRDGEPRRWEEGYTFPAAVNGEIVQSVIQHQRPSGMSGFVLNTRREIFADWRVREALILAFNFEFINQTVNQSRYPRIASYFSNTRFGMGQGAPSDAVVALLEPFADSLTPDALEPYALPVASGGARNRTNSRAALALFEAAGWTVQDGVLKNQAGEAFTFEFTLSTPDEERLASLYTQQLAAIGIFPTTQLVDRAQMTERRDRYDYDVTTYSWGMSLSPGNEQRLYWGSNGVEQPGTRNYAGVNSPAVDAMVEAMLTSRDDAAFTAAAQALDRALMTGRYVVPFWYNPASWLAHDARLRYPDYIPIYGDWVGFLPDVWWWEDAE